MSLDGFHQGLAALVADPELVRRARRGDDRWAARFVPDGRERRRLVAMACDDRMEVLCSLYRSNRLTALVRTVPTVVEAVGPRLADHLTAWWAQSPRTDLQFHAEALDFCRHTREVFAGDPAVVGAIEHAEAALAARFELAGSGGGS